MTLDVWLVGRLALELDERLRGARVQSMRSEPLGLVVACHRRGGPVALVASLAPESPMLAAVDGDPEERESGPGGWAGAVAALLRNATIEAVHAVPDDRIINVDMSSRSAFGVPSRHRLVFELEPRKANALVVRPIDGGGSSVLAVAKAIVGADGRRDVAVGKPYEPPPSRTSRIDEAFTPAPAVDDKPIADGEPRTLARRLSTADPSCSPALAREAVQRASQSDGATPTFERARQAWLAMRPEVARNAADTKAPIYAYVRGGVVGACHCIPLSWAPGDAEMRPSLNELCSEALSYARRRRNAPLASALRKRLGIMLGRCSDEMARLRAAQAAAIDADALRVAGDAIYANLSAIAAGETQFTTPDGLVVVLDPHLEPKENAQAYFKRFRKARSGLPRIAGRLVALEANRALWEQMLWEVERAEESGDPGVFAEVAEAIDLRRSRHAAAQTVPARKERTVALPSGAVAHVGRSPKDNERVTFTVAGPNDLWFHARGIPGAHVVIRTVDGNASPTDDDILAAAALAAGQSRAAAAGKVEVDYTRRKYVRKQGKGRPGLVWYTDFKTVLVTPRKLSL
jgi:predicted ribosome quality control (RQC) complex YloA/Tae2 family protein